MRFETICSLPTQTLLTITQSYRVLTAGHVNSLHTIFGFGVALGGICMGNTCASHTISRQPISHEAGMTDVWRQTDTNICTLSSALVATNDAEPRTSYHTSCRTLSQL